MCELKHLTNEVNKRRFCVPFDSMAEQFLHKYSFNHFTDDDDKKEPV